MTKEREIVKTMCLFILMVVFVGVSNAGSPAKVSKVLNCSFNRNQIIIYEYSNYPSLEEMKTHSENIIKDNTAGRFTTAYFFQKGKSMPRSGQSFCESIAKANIILYEGTQVDSWNFAYSQDVNGKKVFVDCKAEVKSELCRK